jgi:outer membrane lipase/esterase
MLRPRHLACAVALALASSAAVAQSPPAPQPATHAGLFDHMVVFGDSLSDDGNLSLAQHLPQIMRFTTNPGQTAVEDIGDDFGDPLHPSLAGGTDFAFGGAGIDNNSPGTPPAVPTLPVQLGTYLAATDGHADPDSLYAIWGGANDVFHVATSLAAAATAKQVIEETIADQVHKAIGVTIPDTPAAIAAFKAQITPSVTQQVTAQVEAKAGVSTLMDPGQAQTDLEHAAQTELGMLGKLGQAGARYVMVFNLPNIGLTPKALAQGKPAAAALTGFSLIFNNTLNAGLAKTGINIIPVNTFAMLNEIVADPGRFGFTNVTEPACSGGADGSSFACGPAGSGTPASYQPGTENTYLFADGVHPTTAAHAELAQYAESIVIAPGEISLLGEAPLEIGRSLDDAIVDQATTSAARAPGPGLHLWAHYGHARQNFKLQVNSPRSRDNLDVLSIGAGVHPTDALSAGLALTAGQQIAHFAGDAGGFKLRDLLATGYAMWSGQQAYFAAIGSFGHLHYSDVHRNIPIGPAVLHAGGATSGAHQAAALTGGWWVDLGTWRTGPYAEVTWQHVQVDGYAENGNGATAMTFGRQNRHALVGTLGWQIDAHFRAGSALLHPFLRVAWNHDSDADARTVSAGLVSMPGRFALPGFSPDRDWGSVGVGLAANFTPAFSGWIGYEGRFSDSSQHINSLNIGANVRF